MTCQTAAFEFDVAGMPTGFALLAIDALRSKSASIAFEGDLLPCCYVGGRFYKHRHGALGGAESDAAAIFEGFRPAQAQRRGGRISGGPRGLRGLHRAPAAILGSPPAGGLQDRLRAQAAGGGLNATEAGGVLRGA